MLELHQFAEKSTSQLRIILFFCDTAPTCSFKALAEQGNYGRRSPPRRPKGTGGVLRHWRRNNHG